LFLCVTKHHALRRTGEWRYAPRIPVTLKGVDYYVANMLCTSSSSSSSSSSTATITGPILARFDSITFATCHLFLGLPTTRSPLPRQFSWAVVFCSSHSIELSCFTDAVRFVSFRFLYFVYAIKYVTRHGSRKSRICCFSPG